jgi:hypothetical protein
MGHRHDLAEFVEQSLTQILQGIRAAQKQDGGPAIGALIGTTATGVSHNLLLHATGGLFTVVEFDVSVVAETSMGAKGGLKVWSAGVEAGGQRSPHGVA